MRKKRLSKEAHYSHHPHLRHLAEGEPHGWILSGQSRCFDTLAEHDHMSLLE